MFSRESWFPFLLEETRVLFGILSAPGFSFRHTGSLVVAYGI